MPQSVLMTLVGFALVWSHAFAAGAQSSGPVAPSGGAAQTVNMAVERPSSSELEWLREDLAEANQRIRRARNALIATSVITGIGAALLAVGISQCQLITTTGQQDELLCNNSGDILPPLGGTIGGLGAIGMITSGIVLGLGNKRKRKIQGKLRRAQHSRRLQWDPGRGLVEF